MDRTDVSRCREDTTRALLMCSRPMPRARAHIANLLQVHSQQLERIAELERQISEVRRIPSSDSRYQG